MGMTQLFDNPHYQISIVFKPGDPQRQAIVGLMRRRQYRRMVRDYIAGRQVGVYEFVIDGIGVEMTYPLQEMDTITAVAEVTGEQLSGANKQ